MSRLLRLIALLVVAAMAAGCVRMPVEGPIREVGNPEVEEAVAGTSIDPRPPEPGATAQEVVAGFLEAMKATPIKTTVAVQYLTDQAQEQWKPEGATITYSDLGDLRGQRTVTVPLIGSQTYDSRGAWTGATPDADTELEFPLTIEGEEWRIDAAPDALVVPESWFEDRFQRASLHFLDPTGRTLVPEPVFVPAGDQFATALVRGLLAGPTEELARVERSAIPAGLSLGLSVPIDRSGVAEVSLEGPPALPVEGLVSEEMLAQLAWTLRQEPRIRVVRLTLNGRPLPLPGGLPEFSVTSGARFDPAGFGASPDLFALRDDLLVVGELGDFEATSGPLGRQGLGVRSISVNLAATQTAAVSSTGTSVLLAPVQGGEAGVTELVGGGFDLLPPVWDFADRIWLVDRRPGGAVVSVAVEGEVSEVAVDGVTGEDVMSFLVSRDGSRLVAVVRGRGADRVVTSRVLHHEGGRVLRVTPARRTDLEFDAGRRLNDIGWRSPVSVTLLITGDLAQVRTVPVEGAPGDLDTGGASRIRGRSGTLVSSPVRGASAYVVGPDGVTDLIDPVRQIPVLDAQISWLGYVG